MQFKYSALGFQPREGHSPLYMIAPLAEEVTQWADAPHKQTGVRAGYQRELDEGRSKSIREYIEMSEDNILPSAALIAVRPDAIDILGEPDRVVVSISLKDIEPLERRGILLREFRERLSLEELQSVEVSVDDYELEAAREVALTDEEVPEATPPESYLAGLYAELQEYDKATPERRLELDELVDTFTLPGLIIDGQHRIFGAKEAHNSAVRIPVVILPGLDIAEQVFHFYVLNNKAKPLDKRQLRSIVSTSLTKQEISGLYDRFRKSGLRADEAQWTYRVGSDADSPFKGLVSLRLRGDVAPIDDNIMDQVVGRFIRMPRGYNVLKKGVDWGNNDSDYTHRLQLFYALWHAVRDSYPKAWADASAGEPGAQLFQKVALLQLQEYVLKTFKTVAGFTDKSPLSSPELLRESAAKALSRIPEEFFTTEWKRKQLDTNAGRLYFLEQLESVAEQEGKYMKNFGLFKD